MFRWAREDRSNDVAFREVVVAAETAKNAVSVVQRLLKEAFGLPDNPIKPYSGALAWQAKFFASSEIADDEG